MPAEPSIRETHISTVALIGDRAYKFMKPISTPFLDQSTVELRRRACEQELWLNRRIAPDVYLGIGKVFEDDVVVDHFLVMRRLPESRRLSALAGTAEMAGAVREVARTVAAFHARQRPLPADLDIASRDAVQALWNGNLRELDPFAGRVVDAAALARIERKATRYLSGRERLFNDRIEHGFVRDGHGDLLADDIFLLPDGPRVLDCLAFDERLRCSDVLLDVAFLAMDLERLGAPDHSVAFIDAYSEFSNEHHPRSLAHHYIAYRALVRAKISAMRADQGDTDAGAAAGQFFRQCERHLDASQPSLILVGGTPGTGKSTLAANVADATGMIAIASDELRKDLTGTPHDQHAFAPPGEGIYAPAITQHVYDEMTARAARLLEMGESVVLDASWSSAAARASARAAGAALGATVVELRCSVDPAIAKERIVRRLANVFDPSDATPEIADYVAAVTEPWPESIAIDTARSKDESVAAAVDAWRDAVRAGDQDGLA